MFICRLHECCSMLHFLEYSVFSIKLCLKALHPAPAPCSTTLHPHLLLLLITSQKAGVFTDALRPLSQGFLLFSKTYVLFCITLLKGRQYMFYARHLVTNVCYFKIAMKEMVYFRYIERFYNSCLKV